MSILIRHGGYADFVNVDLTSEEKQTCKHRNDNVKQQRRRSLRPPQISWKSPLSNSQFKRKWKSIIQT